MAGRKAGTGTGSAPGEATTLLWLRQDLRLADNRALAGALAAGGRVLPVFVLDQEAGGRWAPGAASLWWLHHSLARLAEAFAARGTTLILRRGDAASVIPALARETGAASVHCGIPHEPWARRMDEEVARTLEADGRRLVAHRVATLFDLDAIRSRTGTRYGVYAPFARTCRALPDPGPPLPAPDRVPGPDAPPAGDRLEAWGLLPDAPDWAGRMREVWVPGEAAATNRLHAFLHGRLDGYGQSRNIPGDPAGTSMLSPYLHWGELSPVQIWHAARTNAAGREAAGAGLEAFRNEILWHEFSAYLLRHNPSLPDLPMRPAMAALPWRSDRHSLRSWRRGRTGIPIVDAGMRQLWQLGWMQNRARMITASFLVKHLLIDWQEGEAWFWDTLVDADLANNAVSWQWIAGTGVDSQPFFRVFNPVAQGRKFDPDGRYVRQYVPELAALPDRWLHEPWAAPQAVLDQAGVRLGRDYPQPVVPLDEGRDRALAAFRATVRNSRAADPAAPAAA